MSNQFPLSEIDKAVWTRKVSTLSLYTVPAEEQSLPFLLEVKELLEHLMIPPLELTIPLDHAEFFFLEVCAAIVTKIIKSRFLKNLRVLATCEYILISTLQLVPLYIHLINTVPLLPSLITIVFPSDQFYKNNSILHYRSNPYDYFHASPSTFTNTLQKGDLVDCVRFATSSDKLEWTQAKVINTQYCVEVQFINDPYQSRLKFQKGSHLLAPFESKSKAKTQWRKSLAINSLVDCQDSFGGWYNGTIFNITGTHYPQADVRLKVYNPKGPKSDSEGTFFGFLDYCQQFSIHSIKLQPYCSVAKQFVYESNKSNYDYVDDINDMEITEVNGQKVYAMPRKRHLSSTIFNALQLFGKNQGFVKILQHLEKYTNIVLLAHFLKGMNVVSAYLHKTVVLDIVQKCKGIIKSVINLEEKNLTREQSQMIFSGIKVLQKRIYSLDKAYEFQNNLKMKLVQKCMNSNVLKKKLQGLAQLKQIVRTISHSTFSNQQIVKWMKDQNLFQKIYFIDSHVQLIKNSDVFFKCCLSQNIIQLQDIQKLLTMAKKGDFATKMSLYSMFQDAGHLYKRAHVEYLVDRIVENPIDQVSNEDLELLYYLSKHSNFFPSHKAMVYFEKIFVSQNAELAAFASKKYADIIAKSYDLRNSRKDTIKALFHKLKIGPFKKYADVLKQVFQGIAVGESGKLELADLLYSYDIQASLFEVIYYQPDNYHTKMQQQQHKLEEIVFVEKIQEKVQPLQLIKKKSKKNKKQQQYQEIYDRDTMQFNSSSNESQELFPLKSMDSQEVHGNKQPQKQIQPILTQKYSSQSYQLPITLQQKQIELKPLHSSQTQQIPKESSSSQCSQDEPINLTERLPLIMQCMKLLKSIYSLCPKIKIQVKTLKAFQRLVEPKYFLRWVQEVLKCEQGLNKQKQGEINEFFQELFNNQLLKKLQMDEFDMFKQVLMDVNELLKEVSSYSYGTISKYNVMYETRMHPAPTYTNYSTTKQCKRSLSFKNIKYISQLQYIIDQTQDQQVADKAIELYTLILSSGYNFPQEITETFNKRWEKFTLFCTQQHSPQILRSLKLIDFIIDESEKGIKSDVQSLIKRRKNKIIKINLLDETKSYSDLVKKVSMSLSLNTTLKQFRKLVAKELDVPVEQMHISYKKQFLQLQNCRTLSQLNFNESDLYSVTRKYSYWTNTVPLTCNNQLTPKAIRVFKSIFDQYSINGKMTQTYCRSFTTKCIRQGGYEIIEQRISKIFKQFGQDITHGYLTFQNFCQFYLQNAISTPSTVWENLKCFGVHSDLRLPGESEEQPDPTTLPRYILASQPSNYTLLFSLLNKDKIGMAAFNLLQRLPVCKEIQTEILKPQELNFDLMLNPKDKLQFFYRLNIVEYFIRGTGTEEEKQWVLRFISGAGYERLLEILVQFIKQQQVIPNLPLIQLLIEILNQFLLNCFCNPQSLHCWSVLIDSSEIDQKLQYFITGKLPGTRTLKIIQHQLIYQFTAMSQSSIASQLITLLKQVWISPQLKSKQAITIKIFNFIGFLLVHHDPSPLVESLSFFIVTPSTPHQIKHLYSVIACYCFTSSNHQLLFIKQLFRCLIDHTVISEHFTILAALVNKFGLIQINEEHTKSVLMHSIYNSTNELTIEGCARLLTNFDLSYLTEADYTRLWNNCVLSQNTSTKDNTKQALYSLLLKMCQSNQALVDVALARVSQTIEQCFSQMKITSCTEINQRASCSYVGLKNLGSICYINSMMQQLFMNKPFRYLIQRIDDAQPPNLVTHQNRLIDDNILHQLQHIFGYLEHSTRMDYIPYGFCLAYKPFGAPVNVMIQQDVQEFISMFFDQLGNRIKDTPFRNIVDNFYGGQNCNMFHCHQCQQTKKVTQTFYSISLEVKNSKTLAQSCNRFIQGQTINDYTCGLCQKKSDVTKITRIGKCPKMLIIHLQRIVFNLDTFINEKITTKHTFPMQFDLTPYTLDTYEKRDVPMNYVLIGIICHIGNAEAGHYISYIKKEEGKWLEFNDSIINTFDISRLDEECFGGNNNTSTASAIDDYEWDKINETTKSAYILIYEQKATQQINLILKDLEQKTALLEHLQLKEYTPKQQTQIKNNQQIQGKSIQEIQEKNIQEIQGKGIQEIQGKGIQEIQGKSIQDNGPVEIKKQQYFKILLDPHITPKIQQNLLSQILNDNKVHSFQKVIASSNFANFFAKILRNDSQACLKLFPVLKKVTFGFWVKSHSFSELLTTTKCFISRDITYVDEIVFNNPSVVSLLLQCSDVDIRSKISAFMVNSLKIVFSSPDFNIEGTTQLQTSTREFLQKLLSLLPNLVSKCWTRFAEYFEFWRDFAASGHQQCRYMLQRDYLKHFIDYFLDKKSPLGIYAKKQHPIGSKFVSPNFTMLLLAVTKLLQGLIQQHYTLTQDDLSLLLHYDTLEKLLAEAVDSLAVQLVPQLCRNNLMGSEKVAVVLIKAIYRNTYITVQPYLNIIEEYLLIDDEHQMLRIYWVLGKQQLALVGKSIAYFNSYMQDQRIHLFNSAINIQQSYSVLESIVQNHRKMENMCMMQLKTLLKVCKKSPAVEKYIDSLESPNIIFSKYTDFIAFFIKIFAQQTEISKKNYYYSATSMKEELIKEVKTLYRFLLNRKKQNAPNTSNEEQRNLVRNKKQENQFEVVYKPTYMPVKMEYIEVGLKLNMNGLLIQPCQPLISYLQLKPNGTTNSSQKYYNVDKNIDRLSEEVWLTEEKRPLKGYFVTNMSNDLLRTKTQIGSNLLRGGESAFVWAERIEKVFVTDRTIDWPKWSLYEK